MAFLPFSERGKAWEPTAQHLRGLAKDGQHKLVDPWALAPKVGLRVIDATDEVMQLL